MKSSEELRRQLRQIDHKGYKAYKILEGEYEFGAYRLCIDHVQGDPFATPSRVRIVYKNQKNIPDELFREKHRKTAIEDTLLRRLHRSIGSVVRGSGAAPERVEWSQHAALDRKFWSGARCTLHRL